LIVKAIGCTIYGIDSYRVEVEVDTAQGLPQFSTVGLPDAAVKESRDRIKAAIKNAGYPFPREHITVNLAPADVRKEGTGLDLPIACAILAAVEVIHKEVLLNYILLGELSLDGSVKGVPGAISAAFHARSWGYKGLILAEESAREAAIVEGIEIIPVRRLEEVVEFLAGRLLLKPLKLDARSLLMQGENYRVDFSDIRGQDIAKRAVEVAVAGGHNMLMVGPPGGGKTMLAQRIPTIMPDLTLEESVETTKIYSIAGLMEKGQGLITRRPFRSPHHTISDAGLIGGGQTPKPGEISLAHNGVLFLDELPEFRRNVLESLRQPLENGWVTITRSALTVTYPARFMLVAAMNPCPCGHFGDKARTCRCTAQQIRQYQGKISSPLLDRIDIHVEVPAVGYQELVGKYQGESSREIRERVKRAREIEKARLPHKTIPLNAYLTDKEVKQFCVLDRESEGLLKDAMERLGLSARAYVRILKLARTIADLEGKESIAPPHIAEAIQYRTLDRRFVLW